MRGGERWRVGSLYTGALGLGRTELAGRQLLGTRVGSFGDLSVCGYPHPLLQRSR